MLPEKSPFLNNHVKLTCTVDSLIYIFCPLLALTGGAFINLSAVENVQSDYISATTFHGEQNITAKTLMQAHKTSNFP